MAATIQRLPKTRTRPTNYCNRLLTEGLLGTALEWSFTTTLAVMPLFPVLNSEFDDNGIYSRAIPSWLRNIPGYPLQWSCGGYPGGMLPIVALTQSASFVTGLLGGAINLTDLDKYFCHWRPVLGSTMVDYDIAKYPFANQTVAANALLAQPLRVSLMMDAPVNENTGAMTKLVTLSALQAVLQAHANPAGLTSLPPLR